MRFTSGGSGGGFAPAASSWLNQLVADFSCKSMCLDFNIINNNNPSASKRDANFEHQKGATAAAATTREGRRRRRHERRIFDTRREFWNLLNNTGQLRMSRIMEESESLQPNEAAKPDGRLYDLVIFGASGSVGRFLVEEMALVIDKQYSSQQQQQQQQPQPATTTTSLTTLGGNLRDPGQFAQQNTRRVSVPRHVDGISWAIAGRSAVKLSDTLCKAEISTGVKDLSIGVPVLLADLNHHRSLLEMCSRTSLVISCAGPYSTDGEALIRACLESRTNYIDLSHESSFIERIRVKYHRAARANNVYILNGCGFQSMSAEMGLAFVKQVVDGQIDEVKIMLNLNDTKARTPTSGTSLSKSSCGIISPGMWDSLLLERSQQHHSSNSLLIPSDITKNEQSEYSVKEEEEEESSSSGELAREETKRKLLVRKDTQTLVRDLVEFRNRKATNWLQLVRGFNEGGRRYCLPVSGFSSEEFQLTRGEMNQYELRELDLRDDSGWRPIICNSFLSLRSLYQVVVLFVWMQVFNFFVQIPLARRLMSSFPYLTTLGLVSSSSSSPSSSSSLSPSSSWSLLSSSSSSSLLGRDSLSHIKFCQTFIAYGTPGDDSGDPLEKREKHLKRKQEQLLVARVVGPEPNHVATATFAIQAALALILEPDHLPAGGGVLTPGAAFSETNIIYQLRRRNMKFEVLKKA